MTFSLAQQNLEAGSPWPVSSANCTGTQKLGATAEGLIGVGTVLGVLILVLVLYALYRCYRRPHRVATATQPTAAAETKSVETDGAKPKPAAYDAEPTKPGTDRIQPHPSRKNSDSNLIKDRRNEEQD